MYQLGRIKFFGALVCALVIFQESYAVDKAQVLPKGVNYLSVRYGIMDHLGEVYSNGGGISYKGDTVSQEIDMAKVRKFANDDLKKEVDKLINVLNTFGNSNIADQLSLGTLEFDVDARVRYTAPIYGRGITDRFTLGIAFPILNFKADIGIRQVGSNVPQIKQEMMTVTAESEELRKGLDRLDENLVQIFQRTVADRGYKPVRSRDETFLGDIQVVGLYQLVRESRENLVLKTGLILPTGPADDADDLTDLPNQHQTSIGTGLINDVNVFKGWSWGTGIHFLFRLPDRADKRVPKNSEESLPAADRKENLDRDLGDSVAVSTNIRYQASDYFEFTTGLESGTKGPDKYIGKNEWDYSILSRDTYQTWNKSVVAVEYSTVTAFIGGRESIPFTISYDFSDIFAGTNIERQQVHEIGLKMFF